MNNDLPNLTYKQQRFVMRYINNDGNASEAYRFAYDCEAMSKESIAVEASKLLKNPNVTPWIDYYKKNLQQQIANEIFYTVSDAFDELESLQQKCMDSSKTYSIAMKAIENKCRLKGLFEEQLPLLGNMVVNMGSVEVDGRKVSFEVGSNCDETKTSENS